MVEDGHVRWWMVYVATAMLRTAGKRGRPWEAWRAEAWERDGDMEMPEAREGEARGGATQRACGLADRRTLLFRSRRRAAGNPLLAGLTRALFTPAFPSFWMRAATTGPIFLSHSYLTAIAREFPAVRVRSKVFGAKSVVVDDVLWTLSCGSLLDELPHNGWLGAACDSPAPRYGVSEWGSPRRLL